MVKVFNGKWLQLDLMQRELCLAEKCCHVESALRESDVVVTPGHPFVTKTHS